MTVAGRILVQIILMHLLRRIEILQRKNLDRQLTSIFSSNGIIYIMNYGIIL